MDKYQSSGQTSHRCHAIMSRGKNNQIDMAKVMGSLLQGLCASHSKAATQLLTWAGAI